MRARTSEDASERKTGVSPVNSPATAATAVLPSPAAPSPRRRAMRWAELIRRVYETDPLLCPKCGGQMKIIAFIESRPKGDGPTRRRRQ